MFGAACFALWLTATAVTTAEPNSTAFKNGSHLNETAGVMRYVTGRFRLVLSADTKHYENRIAVAVQLAEQAGSVCGVLQNEPGLSDSCAASVEKMNASRAALARERERLRAKRRDGGGGTNDRRRRNAMDLPIRFGFGGDGDSVDAKTLQRKLNELAAIMSKTVDKMNEGHRWIVNSTLGMDDASRAVERLALELRGNATEAKCARLLAQLADAVKRVLDELTVDTQRLVNAVTRPLDLLLDSWATEAAVREGLALAAVNLTAWRALPVGPTAESRRVHELLKNASAAFVGRTEVRFEVDVPVVYSEPFKLYRVHPMRPGAFDPSWYLAVTDDCRHYVELAESHVDRACERLSGFRLCEPMTGAGAIRERADEDRDRTRCLDALLADRGPAPSSSPFVRALDSDNAWHCNVDRPTDVTMTCDDGGGGGGVANISRSQLQSGAVSLTVPDGCWASAAGHALMPRARAVLSPPLRIDLFPDPGAAVPNVTAVMLRLRHILDRPRAVRLPNVTVPAADYGTDLRKYDEENAEPNVVNIGGYGPFGWLLANRWCWTVLAGASAYLVLHAVIAYVRRKTLRCVLGKSGAKKFKRHRDIVV